MLSAPRSLLYKGQGTYFKPAEKLRLKRAALGRGATNKCRIWQPLLRTTDGPCTPRQTDRVGGIGASAKGRDVSSANAVGRPEKSGIFSISMVEIGGEREIRKKALQLEFCTLSV